MQLVQVVSFLWTNFVRRTASDSMKWFRKGHRRAFALFFNFTAFIAVPIASIIHWCINFQVMTDENNPLRAWFLTYVLIGMGNIGIFFSLIRILQTL